MLSFYKEELAGEQCQNYIHMRAGGEQKSNMSVLRDLVDETLQGIGMVEVLAGEDRELVAIWKAHVQVSFGQT